ncbi:hypothetical protein [uncultured Hymenobacter sp.]|uniref:anti-sigma factor family protein n=1 Tax=uncultured Hymenobacter sp. TaxID=170016 RepID=UPI0035C9DEC0
MSISSPLFNCQQATLLVERRADEVLPINTRVQLWAHLRLCPYCRRYEVQSALIARQAKIAAQTRVVTEAALSASARARIQQVLDTSGPLPR